MRKKIGTVVVCGHEIKIYVADKVDAGNSEGLFEAYKSEITITSKITDLGQFYEVLLHEIVEAIDIFHNFHMKHHIIQALGMHLQEALSTLKLKEPNAERCKKGTDRKRHSRTVPGSEGSGSGTQSSQ